MRRLLSVRGRRYRDILSRRQTGDRYYGDHAAKITDQQHFVSRDRPGPLPPSDQEPKNWSEGTPLAATAAAAAAASGASVAESAPSAAGKLEPARRFFAGEEGDEPVEVTAEALPVGGWHDNSDGCASRSRCTYDLGEVYL